MSLKFALKFSAAESRLAETQTQLESHKADSSRDKSKLEATIGQQLDLLSQQKTELSDIKRQLEQQQRLNDTAFVERDAAASKEDRQNYDLVETKLFFFILTVVYCTVPPCLL